MTPNEHAVIEAKKWIGLAKDGVEAGIEDASIKILVQQALTMAASLIPDTVEDSPTISVIRYRNETIIRERLTWLVRGLKGPVRDSIVEVGTKELTSAIIVSSKVSTEDVNPPTKNPDTPGYYLCHYKGWGWAITNFGYSGEWNKNRHTRARMDGWMPLPDDPDYTPITSNKEPPHA